MENYSDQLQHLVVDDFAKVNLLETARWVKFLAVIGMVMLGLLILFSIFFGTIMATILATSNGMTPGSAVASSTVMIFVCFVSVGLYVYPIYAMYQFAVVIRRALAVRDQQQFNRALRHLKGLFQYLGILTLIFILIYAIAFAMMVVGGMAAMGSN